MKFKTHICLSIATGLGCGAKFDEMHECITHVLGWNIFTHELADKGVWARANELVLAAQPSLVPYAKRLRLVAPDEPTISMILTEAVANLGTELWLPAGNDKRSESPVDSMQRIAPGKPIVKVVIPPRENR